MKNTNTINEDEIASKVNKLQLKVRLEMPDQYTLLMVAEYVEKLLKEGKCDLNIALLAMAHFGCLQTEQEMRRKEVNFDDD